MEEPASCSSGRDVFENEWSGMYASLKARGYTLRPRYQPNWKPTWDPNDFKVFDREDDIVQERAELLDATRGDGTVVYIKRVDRKKYPTEVEIVNLLSSSTLRSDKFNHCVPILDCFEHEKQPDLQYLVMPLLRQFDDPAFTTVKEVVEFVDQTLQGLVFMHRHNVAHRDCSAQNIMMDASDLYPDGWHPIDTWLTRDAKRLVTPRKNRCDANIKYYFIDYGLSTRFAPGEPHLVVGAKGASAAPELSREIPYNPFKLDVYLLGRVFEQSICEAYDVAFLEPLVQDMTAFHPDDRPTAQEALKRWRLICESGQVLSMDGRLHSKGESVQERIVGDVAFYATYAYKRLTSA